MTGFVSPPNSTFTQPGRRDAYTVPERSRAWTAAGPPLCKAWKMETPSAKLVRPPIVGSRLPPPTGLEHRSAAEAPDSAAGRSRPTACSPSRPHRPYRSVDRKLEHSPPNVCSLTGGRPIASVNAKLSMGKIGISMARVAYRLTIGRNSQRQHLSRQQFARMARLRIGGKPAKEPTPTEERIGDILAETLRIPVWPA